MTLKQVTQEVVSIIEELADARRLKSGQVLVIGASTSEVLGKRIGTGGADEVAAAIFEAVQLGRERIGYLPVFQCCEHLNRALVAEQEAVERFDWLEVAAVPVPKAGGAMAAYAYRHLPNAMLVESVQAHVGIDIGDTMIGMHLRKVAVPFRPSVKQVGYAHVTAAYSRPPLIGGERAVYRQAKK